MPLSGLRVIDLSRFLPGPQAAALLGDYGAQVIRVELPRAVEARDRALGIDRLTGAKRARARACDMAGRNKNQVLIDFFSPAGREQVLKLAASADVLIHDFRAGTIEKAGLGAAAMRAVNRRLVYCAVSATGEAGPRGGRPGHDPVALALSGALSRTADEPHLVGFPPADLLTAAHAAFAILAALRRRDATDEGAVLDAAMSDSAMALMTSVFTRQQRSGDEPPIDFRVGDNAVFATKDGGHVVATNMERPFWDRFCEAADWPEGAARFDDEQGRAEKMARLAAIFRRRDRAEWDAFAREHDLQIAPVLSCAEALREPHHHARGALVAMSDGTVLSGRPVRFADLPPASPRPAGEPGRDQSVLEEFS